ncbi:hypothetical protein [Nonomuraea sp. SBT364]|uniref:hypothetical protein n=1 Tax=Nonomuraea sp. SBT364 TaxID=1580530 RepID=UPI00069D6070|nr:hypothetical protein [Nonomuraea sp. SBT364]
MTQLDDSPFRGEEPAARPRQGASRLTLALVAGVVLVAGVLIGIQAQKALGTPATTAASPGTRGNVPQQGGGRQRMTGGGTVGTVEKVEKGKVYLRTMDGSTVTVTTTGATTVQVSRRGSVSDLEAGATVMVRGERGGDGSVSATAITQTGSGR